MPSRSLRVRGILSYPNMYKPTSPPRTDSDPKFNCVIILDPTKADELQSLKTIKQYIQEVANEEWGKDAGKYMWNLYPLKSGDKDMAGKMGFDGKWFINPKKDPARPPPPYMVQKNMATGLVVEVPEDKSYRIFYPGTYVSAYISIFSYTSGKQGVTISVEGLAFVRHGERLDGRPAVEDMFAEDLADMESSDQPVDDFNTEHASPHQTYQQGFVTHEAPQQAPAPQPQQQAPAQQTAPPPQAPAPQPQQQFATEGPSTTYEDDLPF